MSERNGQTKESQIPRVLNKIRTYWGQWFNGDFREENRILKSRGLYETDANSARPLSDIDSLEEYLAKIIRPLTQFEFDKPGEIRLQFDYVEHDVPFRC